MKHTSLPLLALTGIVLTAVQTLAADAVAADPRAASWFTAESTKYARVRETDAAAAAGAATWTGQTLPAYAGVQEVASDAGYLYVRSHGLAGYVMGPWYLNAARTQLFPNRPLARNNIWRFTLTPVIPASKTLTGLGAVGLYVNGVSLFDNRDAFFWNGTAEANGNGQWNRDAYVNEGVTFDKGGAHQEQSGNYHYHAQPPALRLQLGDNISYNAGTGLYSEDTSNLHHSPILAWVSDGLPIYGPYGYSNATNAASGVRRMVSGFVIRNGQNGTDTGRATIPAWAVRAYGASTVVGPPVNAIYPLGRYLEDNAYLGDLTNSATGQRYQMGTDFDLNEWNARWCVTPEFPAGTWAYFLTINASGTPVFPYAIGRQYFGTPSGTQPTAIPTNGVTTHFLGGPNSRESLNAPSVAGGNVTLTWSALEGGIYRVESNTDISTTNWAALNTNVVAAGQSATYIATGGGSGPQGFFRVARTALAGYYGGPTDGGGGTGNISASPNSGNRGAMNLFVTFTINATTPTLPPANVVPNVVTIGTVAASAGSIARPTSTTVTATFNIPAGAATGAQAVTITFPGPGGGAGPSYTQAGAFTIN